MLTSRQWFFVILTPIIFSLLTFFLFSSVSSAGLNSSLFWYFAGMLVFTVFLAVYSRKLFFSKQGFIAGVFNLLATIILLFLYSFNFLTNVFVFVAASILFFFLIDFFISRSKKVSLKMLAGVAIVFAGLVAAQWNGLVLNSGFLILGFAIMVTVAGTNFTMLYNLDSENLISRLESFFLPLLLIPLIFLSSSSILRWNAYGFLGGVLNGVGFFIFCYALIKIYDRKKGFWSRNLVNMASYFDIIILNVFALLAFQGKYTLNGLVGSIVVFMGIVVFILSEPSN